jgi:hypothetical protein
LFTVTTIQTSITSARPSAPITPVLTRLAETKPAVSTVTTNTSNGREYWRLATRAPRTTKSAVRSVIAVRTGPSVCFVLRVSSVLQDTPRSQYIGRHADMKVNGYRGRARVTGCRYIVVYYREPIDSQP